MMITRRRNRECSRGPLILAGLLCFVTKPLLADSPKIVRIEEQWELQVGEPDVQRNAPQATMVISPHDDLEGVYFLFTLNHRNADGYQPGGMQVQMWDGEELVDSMAGSAESPLNLSDDVIGWTQCIAVDDSTLSFEVVNGSSTSWGSFGSGGSLRISSPTTLQNLGGYRPAVSLGESRVGYAGNRVVALVLQKLTWYTDDGEVHYLSAPIDIDADLDP